MKQITDIKDILKALNGISDGWCDANKNVGNTLDKNFKKNYVLLSPEEVEEYKVGTCFDLVELERAYFKSIGKKCNSYFMVYYESKRVFTHAFIVYDENEKFYWLEYSLEKSRGIHEYMSLFDLLNGVRDAFKKYHGLKYMDLDYLCVYKYKKPKAHIGLKDLYNIVKMVKILLFNLNSYLKSVIFSLENVLKKRYD